MIIKKEIRESSILLATVLKGVLSIPLLIVVEGKFYLQSIFLGLQLVIAIVTSAPIADDDFRQYLAVWAVSAVLTLLTRLVVDGWRK
ncbi:hypothetical protein AALA56_09245 [Streptococcus hyointestinalis]|uniref:hypothetical protein n=1 Tax=Streptococcus TaxID=1301 RepID=UPI0026ECFA7A|nr:hypothetical protein [Streptococcus merionis]